MFNNAINKGLQLFGKGNSKPKLDAKQEWLPIHDMMIEDLRKIGVEIVYSKAGWEVKANNLAQRNMTVHFGNPINALETTWNLFLSHRASRGSGVQRNGNDYYISKVEDGRIVTYDKYGNPKAF